MAGKSSPTKLAAAVRRIAKIIMKLDDINQSTKVVPRRGQISRSNAGPVVRAADKYLKKSSGAKMKKASPTKAGKAKASPTKIAKAVTKTSIGRKVTKALKKKAAKKKK